MLQMMFLYVTSYNPKKYKNITRMNFRMKLLKRYRIKFATTVPHIVLLILGSDLREYNVIWEYYD